MLGGKVCSLRLANGEQSVARVYNKAGDLGGLAMSRSVGDFYLQRYGVISEPDLYEREIVDQTIGILIGTDGLTTSCGMSTSFSTILAERSPQRGLKKLAKKCYQQMMDYSGRQYVDDISGVYVQIHPISNYPNANTWIDRIPLSQSPLWEMCDSLFEYIVFVITKRINHNCNSREMQFLRINVKNLAEKQ